MVQEPWQASEPDAGSAKPNTGSAKPKAGSIKPDAGPARPAQKTPPKNVRATTRAGVIWTFTVVAILVLILLVIFMMQNQAQATVYFLGFEGEMALGISMLLAAVGGALVVAVVAAARIIQLRSRAGAAAKFRKR